MRETRAQAIERAGRESRECDSARRVASTLLEGGKPDAQERVKDPGNKGGHYMLRLFGASDADGGTIVVTFHYPGQRDSHRFDSFDAWAHGAARVGSFSDVGLAFAIAAERLRIARNRIAGYSTAA